MIPKFKPMVPARVVTRAAHGGAIEHEGHV